MDAQDDDISATRGRVHIALTPIPVETADELEARYASLLDESERVRFDRLRAPGKRREFLVTRALVRTQLSRFAPLNPREWCFVSNEQGRPEIANEGVDPALRFNLSNTRGLVACAITRGADVGIDVEDTTITRGTVAIADRFFSPTEVAELRALPEEHQRDRFFDYWTLKEAYIKARGLGLAIPLDGFSFRFNPLRIELDPSVGTDAAQWQFWQQSPFPSHRLGLAVRGATAPLAPSVEWVTPPID